MNFPKHKAGLQLTHQEHKGNYETLTEFIERDHYTWESDESRQQAVDSDQLWTLQWYPDTPVGFFAIAAPTLESLLAYAAIIR